MASKFTRTGLNHAERRGIGRQTSINGELEVIMRVIGIGIDRKATGRAVFEPLINRQNDKFSSAAKLALHQDAGQIGFHAGAVGAVIFEDGSYLTGDLHGESSRQLVAVLLLMNDPIIGVQHRFMHCL